VIALVSGLGGAFISKLAIPWLCRSGSGSDRTGRMATPCSGPEISLIAAFEATLQQFLQDTALQLSVLPSPAFLRNRLPRARPGSKAAAALDEDPSTNGAPTPGLLLEADGTTQRRRWSFDTETAPLAEGL